VFVTLTDNWIEMTIRYVVLARERRQVKAQLHRELLERFEADTDVTIASATVEIVGLPAIQVSDTGRGPSQITRQI
jgi:hypothetical protein